MRTEGIPMAELNDNATHEEITAYVDEAIKNVEADRVVEEKTDAQKVAADADKPTGDMTAESDTGSDKTADKGDETSEPEGQEWLDDKLKAEVAAYGIDEKEIAEFTSREELDRALRLFDRKALDAGRKALAESEEGKVRDEKGRFLPKTPAKAEAKAEEKEIPATDGRYEITLKKEDFDDRLVDELTRLRDHYESRFQSLEALASRLDQMDAKAEEDRFDAAVDSLSMPKLFGKTGSESADELQRRSDLMVQVKAQQIGLRQLTGRDVALDALVARVAPMVFSEEFDKQKLKSRTRKISQQSNARQGGVATRPTDPPENVREEMRRLYKELEKA